MIAREVIWAASNCPRFRYYTTTPCCVTFGRCLAFSVLQLPCGVLRFPGPINYEAPCGKHFAQSPTHGELPMMLDRAREQGPSVDHVEPCCAGQGGGTVPMLQMGQQKLGGETVPEIPQQDAHGGLPSAWPETTPQKAGTKTSWEGPQKAVEAVSLCQHLSPYLKAAAASPRRPSAPGWWLLWGQEVVRQPGTARDVGWHQPPWCPLRNWWAQSERSGMSQPPCQGQQEVTSTAMGLAQSLALPEAPLTSRVSGS